jgi:hypothetical protein
VEGAINQGMKLTERRKRRARSAPVFDDFSGGQYVAIHPDRCHLLHSEQASAAGNNAPTSPAKAADGRLS